MKKIKIGDKWVGDGFPCFIIAEAGSNHNRKLSQAKKLIDVARQAGADAVKFQIYSAETLYSKRLKVLPGDKETPFDIIKKIETPRDWIEILAHYSQKQGLIFLATPFDQEAIDQLNPFMSTFKWASPELIDQPLLEYAAKKGKPMIISTGFYGLVEVAEAVKWVKAKGNKKIILLQCTGLYPTKTEEVNLAAMAVLANKFQCPVGFSDHTLSINIPAAAVALGANVIEKHYTLSRKLKGPDHNFALEPKELKEMVDNIRETEKAIGFAVKRPVKREIDKEKLIRRGIVLKRDLVKGEKVRTADLTTKRMGQGGILPKDFSKIVGKKIKKDIKEDEKITWLKI